MRPLLVLAIVAVSAFVLTPSAPSAPRPATYRNLRHHLREEGGGVSGAPAQLVGSWARMFVFAPHG